MLLNKKQQVLKPTDFFQVSYNFSRISTSLPLHCHFSRFTRSSGNPEIEMHIWKQITDQITALSKFSAFLWFAPLQNKRNFANQKQQYRKGKSRRWWQNDMGIWIRKSWCLGYGCHWVQQPLLLGIKNTSRQLKSWPQDGTMLGKIIAECLVQTLNPGLISIFELELELKGVRPLVTRGGRDHIFVLLTRAWLL